MHQKFAAAPFSSWVLLGGEEVLKGEDKKRRQRYLEKGGNEMTNIVHQTKYGDTIFVSQPLSTAQAMVTWAVETYGLLVHSMKVLGNGCVKVEIPGLTSVTYAPAGAPEV